MPDWPIPVPVLTSKTAACSRSWWCHKAIIRLGNGYFGSVARARPHPTGCQKALAHGPRWMGKPPVPLFCFCAWSRMTTPFLYRCPDTGQTVQG